MKRIIGSIAILVGSTLALAAGPKDKMAAHPEEHPKKPAAGQTYTDKSGTLHRCAPELVPNVQAQPDGTEKVDCVDPKTGKVPEVKH